MQLLPETTPLGYVREDGLVIIDHGWWLLFYNIMMHSVDSGFSPDGDPISMVDDEATDSDATVNRAGIAEALALASDNDEPFFNDGAIAQALILAQDELFPDPIPMAQPSQAITVGVSPFSYTAPFNGSVAVSGGTVSVISIIRQGVTVATGVIAGFFALSRLDQIQVTYTVAPTMAFLPT